MLVDQNFMGSAHSSDHVCLDAELDGGASFLVRMRTSLAQAVACSIFETRESGCTLVGWAKTVIRNDLKG